MSLPQPHVMEWFHHRSSRGSDWDAARLIELKAARGITISVVIPAKNEESTVSSVVSGLRSELMERHQLIDELIVIDSDSTDATAQKAADAGAHVWASSAIAPEHGTFPGKGEALWKSLFVSSGEILVFVDADLTLWTPHFVTALVGPLLATPGVHLVKGYYDRISDVPGGAIGTEGGRVTELVARPLLNLWFPHLCGLVQPLAGEWAASRELMETMVFPTGYAVEIASILHADAMFGVDAIAQVDLGARAHQHQSTHDLGLMAAELLAVTSHWLSGPVVMDPELLQFRRDDAGGIIPVSRPLPVAQRVPAATTDEYRSRRIQA